ncbi:MAG TPA: Holliday junction branch migration protein RuvA [Polyangia bacterium]|jgi:Holliday junction DNA helicase RuvA|nr:Holliday junction branch migration protein RuvA [Polyangia bacterium]
MIAFLRGDIIGDDGDAIIVEVGGVGYHVLPSAATKAALPGSGQVRLHIHAHFVTDEPLRLYGFSTTSEKNLFQTLLSVQGVGPRVALAILAGIETEELVRAIATGDVARLRQVKGVGGKIAERLALELREKILTVGAGVGAKTAKGKTPAAGAAPTSAAPVGPLGEVYGALVLLGYKPAEIDPLLEKLDETKPFDENVRSALAALRRG